MAGTMLDVLDMTDFENGLDATFPCVKCDPAKPEKAEWMIRFAHQDFESHHLLAYCTEHKDWMMANPANLYCDKCQPGKSLQVTLISSWAI